jgi:hypothetical protein
LIQKNDCIQQWQHGSRLSQDETVVSGFLSQGSCLSDPFDH